MITIADQPRIKHREHGTVYRLIRTVARNRDLYWVARGIYPDGSEMNGLIWISVDTWAAGVWEVAE